MTKYTVGKIVNLGDFDNPISYTEPLVYNYVSNEAWSEVAKHYTSYKKVPFHAVIVIREDGTCWYGDGEEFFKKERDVVEL